MKKPKLGSIAAKFLGKRTMKSAPRPLATKRTFGRGATITGPGLGPIPIHALSFSEMPPAERLVLPPSAPWLRGDLAIVAFGPNGDQVAQVLEEPACGAVTVRKWRHATKTWTGPSKLPAARLLRRPAEDDPRLELIRVALTFEAVPAGPKQTARRSKR